MKKNDLIVIGAVGFIAAILSFVISGIVFGSPKKNAIKVPEVNPISSTFPLPQTDSNYKSFLNNNALDPTQLIQIGNNNNQVPFSKSAN